VPGDPFPGRGLAPQAHGTPGWTTKAGEAIQDPLVHLRSSGTDLDDHGLPIPLGPAPGSRIRRSREVSSRGSLRGGELSRTPEKGSQGRGSKEPLEGSPSGADAGGWPTEGGPRRGSGEPDRVRFVSCNPGRFLRGGANRSAPGGETRGRALRGGFNRGNPVDETRGPSGEGPGETPGGAKPRPWLRGARVRETLQVSRSAVLHRRGPGGRLRGASPRGSSGSEPWEGPPGRNQPGPAHG
jgi:hypothetical protein